MTLGRSALWIALASLVAYGVAFLTQMGQFSAVMREFGQQADLGAVAGMGVVGFLCLLPLAAALGVVLQVIYVAIVQFVAGALGGPGTFRGLFVATAAFAAPVTLANGLLSIIPFLGACLTLPISLYAIYLSAVAVKSVNQFSWGRAIVTLLVPIVLFGLLALVLFLAFLMPVMNEVMREMGALGLALV